MSGFNGDSGDATSHIPCQHLADDKGLVWINTDPIYERGGRCQERNTTGITLLRRKLWVVDRKQWGMNKGVLALCPNAKASIKQ